MNLNTFLHQGGYAFYVWGAYGMAVFALSLEIFLLRQQRKIVLARIRRLLRRNV